MGLHAPALILLDLKVGLRIVARDLVELVCSLDRFCSIGTSCIPGITILSNLIEPKIFSHRILVYGLTFKKILHSKYCISDF